MISSTRRGFLAGALATTTVPTAVARGESEPQTGVPQAEQEIVRRGRAIAAAPRGRHLVVAHDQRRTVAIFGPDRKARIVDVGGQPLDVAVSPDGRLAAVTTAFWDEPGLVVLDLAGATVRARLEVGPAPRAVAFAADGRRLVVAGGEQEGAIAVVDVQRLAIERQAAIGTVPRGMAAAPDGQVWVALHGLDRVVRIDPRTGRIRRTLRTPRLPDRLAVAPDGRRLLVSHGGADADTASEVVIASGRVTRHPAGRLASGVAWTARGHRLIALGGAGELLAIGADGRRRRHRAGAAPRGIAVAGARAWTVDALTGAITGVRL